MCMCLRVCVCVQALRELTVTSVAASSMPTPTVRPVCMWKVLRVTEPLVLHHCTWLPQLATGDKLTIDLAGATLVIVELHFAHEVRAASRRACTRVFCRADMQNSFLSYPYLLVDEHARIVISSACIIYRILMCVYVCVRVVLS